MAWNADATRMPYRMHSEYLRHLFLDNDLAEGRCVVDGQIISLSDLHAPIFAVGATHDHVAPWKSVYRLHDLTESDITFVLADGGHNGGSSRCRGAQPADTRCCITGTGARM